MILFSLLPLGGTARRRASQLVLSGSSNSTHSSLGEIFGTPCRGHHCMISSQRQRTGSP